MEHLSNDHEDHRNQHENSYKLCDETGHPVVNLMEIQWELREQHDLNFRMEKSQCISNISVKAIVYQILVSKRTK